MTLSVRLLIVLLLGCGRSAPPPPVERNTIMVPDGDVWVLTSSCPPNGSSEEKRESVARFEIDRDPVSCYEWNACVAVGKCQKRRTHECRGNVMEVGLLGATTFCQWRGRRLPTWAEWARAARGESKLLQRDEGKPCVEIAHNSERLNRCVYHGPTGMSFALTTHWQGEWTSDEDCYEMNGRADGGRLQVTVGLGDKELSRTSANTAAFRCVKSPADANEKR